MLGMTTDVNSDTWPLHGVLLIKGTFLTIAFDDTIAVVANVSKQLRGDTGERKARVSNKVAHLMGDKMK